MNLQSSIRSVLILSFLAIAMNSGYSQSNIHKKAFYAEAFGPGLIYSMNYDWRFKNDYKGHGARIGISALNFSEGFWAAVPISYNFIFSKDFKTSIELGAGLTFALGQADFANFSDKLVFGHLIVGVRYRPFENSFFLKAGWTPIFTDDKSTYIFGNIGLGFSI